MSLSKVQTLGQWSLKSYSSLAEHDRDLPFFFLTLLQVQQISILESSEGHLVISWDRRGSVNSLKNRGEGNIWASRQREAKGSKSPCWWIYAQPSGRLLWIANFAGRDSFIVEDPFPSTFKGYLVNSRTLKCMPKNTFLCRYS